MSKRLLVLVLVLACVGVIGLVMCSRANIAADPTTTPTLAISETPSDTPEPLTATPTPTKVAPAAVPSRTATATETAVSPPPTAVSPSPTPTATPTAPPAPTATLSFWLVQPGDNLSLISEWLCGRQDWMWIYRENQDQIRDPNLIFSGQRLIIPWPCPERG